MGEVLTTTMFSLFYQSLYSAQVKSGTIFDNILITDDEEYASEFGEETWGKTKGPEKTMKDTQDEEERKKAEEAAKAMEDEEGDEEDEEEGDDVDVSYSPPPPPPPQLYSFSSLMEFEWFPHLALVHWATSCLTTSLHYIFSGRLSKKSR